MQLARVASPKRPTPDNGFALYLNALGLETESADVGYKTTISAAACPSSPFLGSDAGLKIAMIARLSQPHPGMLGCTGAVAPNRPPRILL